jgi:hypothetical protein
MDESTAAAWEAGAYARCLRDARAANAQQAASAAALWNATFNNPELWLDAEDDAGRQYRPTEYEALKRVFNACTGAKTVWARWLDERDAEVYGTTLETLEDNVKILAKIKAEQEAKAARLAELKAIKESQLQLPAPLGIAAA